jgi:hypothetical protein
MGKKKSNALNTELLKQSLIAWYEEDPQRIEIIRVLVEGEQPPSRREIEYSVINYAKKYGVNYFIHKPDGQIVTFDMYSSYKSTGKNTPGGKDNFDPFRRGPRFQFHNIDVTVGFLNFFRWAMEHKVLEYVKNHSEAIEKDMSNAYRKRNREKKISINSPKNKKKKKQLNHANAYRCIEYLAHSKSTYMNPICAPKPFKSVRFTPTPAIL